MREYTLKEVISNIKPGEKYKNTRQDWMLKTIECDIYGDISCDIIPVHELATHNILLTHMFYKIEPIIEFKCAYVQYEPDGDEKLVAVGKDVDNPTRLEFAVLVNAHTGEAVHFCKVCEIVTKKLTKEEYFDMPYIIEA